MHNFNNYILNQTSGRCLIYRCGHVTSWVLDLTLVQYFYFKTLFSSSVEKVLTEQLNGSNQELIQSILHAQAEWCLYRIFDMVSPSLSSLSPLFTVFLLNDCIDGLVPRLI